MKVSRSLSLPVIAIMLALLGRAEPQVVEYSRGGADYVVSIFTEHGEFLVPEGVSNVNYLVVGGGGGGGGIVQYGGGGGAGGLAEGELSVVPGERLSIAVGAGGAGATGTSAAGNGGVSAILRGGVALVSMAGGGAGGSNDAGSDGACGGGGAKGKVGGSGSVGHSGFAGSAGGGGAGGGGMGGGSDTVATVPTIGTPGAGVVAAITGAAVTYAAGGAGGSVNGPVPAAGGAGTGNGGGGARKGQTDGFAGGSGVVVVRYARPGGKLPNEWVVEPSLGEAVFVEGEGTTIVPGEAKSGAAVLASYTENELRALPRGEHTIAFAVAESDVWSALEKEIRFFVRSMAFPAPGDPDTGETTYVWRGGEGYWCDPGRWTADRTPCYGYPNSAELASAVVAAEATIKADPDGDEFGPAQVKDVTISAATTFTGGVFDVSGMLTATAGVRLVDAEILASAKNQLLLFAGDVVASNASLVGSKATLYAYGNGVTFVEEGAAGTNALHNVRIGYYGDVRSTGTCYVVRNGAGFKPSVVNVGNAGSQGIRFVIDGTEVELVNGATVQTGAGAVDSFVELRGPDARLTVTKGTLTAGAAGGEPQSSGLSFRLPPTPYASAPVVKKPGAGSGAMNVYGNAVIELDVTDVLHKSVYPLIFEGRSGFGMENAAVADSGSQESYLRNLGDNMRVVVREGDGSVKEVDRSRVTLSIDGGVLYATVRVQTGWVLIVR